MSSTTVNSSLSRARFPGFGLSLKFTSWELGPHLAGSLSHVAAMFPNALDIYYLSRFNAGLPFTTLREFTMLQLMNQITDKPDWHIKVFDDTIVSKWKAEIREEVLDGKDITEAMVEYCISELRYKAKVFRESGIVRVYNGDVVKSDTIILAALREELKLAVSALENTSEKEKDWHPGSNQQVLDLVHPSLFPLVFGRTRILPYETTTLSDCIERCGEGVIVPVPPIPGNEVQFNTRISSPVEPPEVYSEAFQWLPCNVDISGHNDDTKIKSYINNLHPEKHRELYVVLEKIIAQTIPLWNATLTTLKHLNRIKLRIPYYKAEYESDPEVTASDEEWLEQREDEDDDDHSNRKDRWIRRTSILRPEPAEFTEPEPPTETVDLRRDYGQHGLQIIIKLANIHLTPENPKYEGGSWHVEGKLNEHICASAIYYYDVVNITPSSLAFRQQIDVSAADNINYGQDEHEWIEEIYGCENRQPGVQDVGSVDTREGRLLTWPNVLQHQVQPFELADPTKPGHRKILALFLVDPNIRIISTANVPCQRKDWWMEAILRDGGPLSKLPRELRDEILKLVDDFPLELDEAKELRLRLMEERKKFTVWHGDFIQESVFSLCEH